MNRMKVFLLLAVMIGFSSCQSRSKQNIEQEVEVDSLSTNPTEEIKIITGVVKDASMNNFMLITLQGDTLFISTMDQEPNDVAGFELGDTVRVNYIEGGRTRVKYYTDRSKSDCDRKEKPESINN